MNILYMSFHIKCKVHAFARSVLKEYHNQNGERQQQQVRWMTG